MHLVVRTIRRLAVSRLCLFYTLACHAEFNWKRALVAVFDQLNLLSHLPNASKHEAEQKRRQKHRYQLENEHHGLFSVPRMLSGSHARHPEHRAWRLRGTVVFRLKIRCLPALTRQFLPIENATKQTPNERQSR